MTFRSGNHFTKSSAKRNQRPTKAEIANKRSSRGVFGDDSAGSVGNSFSNEANALLASQAAMSVLNRNMVAQKPAYPVAKTEITSKTAMSKIHLPANGLNERSETRTRKVGDTHRANSLSKDRSSLLKDRNLLSKDRNLLSKDRSSLSKDRNLLSTDRKSSSTSTNSLSTSTNPSSTNRKHTSNNMPDPKRPQHLPKELLKNASKAPFAKERTADMIPASPSTVIPSRTRVSRKAKPVNRVHSPYDTFVFGAESNNSNSTSGNHIKATDLSAMAASRALSGCQTTEIDSASIEPYDNNSTEHLPAKSFKVLDVPRKLSTEEKIREQEKNEPFLRNLKGDIKQALKINQVTGMLASDILQNYEHGCVAEVNSLEKEDKKFRNSEVTEKQVNEQNLNEQNLKEKQVNEQNLNEQNLKEKQVNEQNLNEQQLKEKQVNEQNLNEQQLNGQNLNEKQLNKQQLIEKQSIKTGIEADKYEQKQKPFQASNDFKASKRIPPPLLEDEISFAAVPESTNSDIYEQKSHEETDHMAEQNSNEEIYEMFDGFNHRYNETTDSATENQSIPTSPTSYSSKFRAINEPFSSANLLTIQKTESRAESTAGKLSDENETAQTAPKIRRQRTHSISALFKDMISQNPGMPTRKTSNSKSFTPDDEPILKKKTSRGVQTTTPNILRRTIRSLSLSLQSSATERSNSGLQQSPSELNADSDTHEEEEEKEQEEARENERPVYSVLQSNVLPSYYSTSKMPKPSVNSSESNLKLLTTLRGDTNMSKRSRLKSYIGLGHSSDREQHASKHHFFDKMKNKLSTDDIEKRLNGNTAANSASDHKRSGSESELESYANEFNLDEFGTSDDILSYFDNQKELLEDKSNNKGHKTEMLLKLPAKLAYTSMKKRADNWEFNKNNTFRKVANTEEKRLHLPDDSNTHNQELLSVTSKETPLQSESNYIIGIHSRPRPSHKFDQNKPWKSHVDLGYITSEEKKRYEGIWVSNKNRFLEMVPQTKKRDCERQASIGADQDACDHNDQQLPSNREEVVSEKSLQRLQRHVSNNSGELSTTSLHADGILNHHSAVDEDLMVNFVVYEIYNRSNLPPRILKQIYSMVDSRHDCTLNKKSFIVGMWLIDQCLYGRKLPAVIPDLVWESVDKMVIGVDVSPRSLQRNKKRNARREIKELKRHEKLVKEVTRKEQQLEARVVAGVEGSHEE